MVTLCLMFQLYELWVNSQWPKRAQNVCQRSLTHLTIRQWTNLKPVQTYWHGALKSVSDDIGIGPVSTKTLVYCR